MIGFISPDNPAILFLTAGDIGGTDLYAYCLNDPINYTDANGRMPFFLVTGIIGLGIGAFIGGLLSSGATLFGAFAASLPRQNKSWKTSIMTLN